jgi:NNMT/PNMT/TEMT family
MRNIEEREFDHDTFDPRGYLREYYLTIDAENDQLLRFFSACYKNINPRSTLLEFGSGPTLYSLITAAANVDIIHVSDRLTSNLHEIQLWKRGDEKAFNWEPFIRRALELEGKSRVTREDLRRRAELLRSKLTAFCTCDAFSRPPLQGTNIDKYDIVQVNFVPESITSSLVEWKRAMHNIISLLKPQGTLILTALKNAVYYQLQEKKFPAVSIDETVLTQTLRNLGFGEAHILLQTVQANLPYRGYSSILLVKAEFVGDTATLRRDQEDVECLSA